MKRLYLIPLFVFLSSCEKFLSEPLHPGIDHGLLQERDATVTDRMAPGCSPDPVMLRISEPVKNYSPYYIDDKGNFDTRDDERIMTDLREVWAHNLPDTLFAPGQRLKILFRTYDPVFWWRCRALVPNFIGLHGVLVVYFEDELEVTEVRTKCDQLVQVRVKTPYPPYIGTTPVLTSNLPDSLKVLGRKFRCTYRFAGYKEHKGCKDGLYDTQLVIKEIK